jgi:hypothetical protein
VAAGDSRGRVRGGISYIRAKLVLLSGSPAVSQILDKHGRDLVQTKNIYSDRTA